MRLTALPVALIFVAGVALVMGAPRRHECKHSLVAGNCSGNARRYFYNTTSRRCEKSSYSVCYNGGNSFPTMWDCVKLCNPDQSPGKCERRVPPNCTKETNVTTAFYYDICKGTCVQFPFCGKGTAKNLFGNFSDCHGDCSGWTLPENRTVPARNNTQICTGKKLKWKVDRCWGPIDNGLCHARIPTWTNNYTTGICEEAFYGGCTEDGNNFLSKGDCEFECREQPKNDCTLDHEDGPCRARIPSWYYNATARQCYEFIYGGCQGNGNNFESKSDCLVTCDRSRSLSSIRPEFATACKPEPEETGCLFDAFYYYDWRKNECRPFVRQCPGGDNYYERKERCIEACVGRPERNRFVMKEKIYRGFDKKENQV